MNHGLSIIIHKARHEDITDLIGAKIIYFDNSKFVEYPSQLG